MKLKDAEDHHLEDADLKVAAQPQVGLCTFVLFRNFQINVC